MKVRPTPGSERPFSRPRVRLAVLEGRAGRWGRVRPARSAHLGPPASRRPARLARPGSPRLGRLARPRPPPGPAGRHRCSDAPGPAGPFVQGAVGSARPARTAARRRARACGCPVGNSRWSCWLIRLSGGGGEVESLEVGGAAAVEGLVCPPGVEAVEAEGGGGEGVLRGRLGQAGVAGAADAGDCGGPGDGALDAGAGGVAGFPLTGVPGGAGGGEGLADRAGPQAGRPAAGRAAGRRRRRWCTGRGRGSGGRRRAGT
jgi:hypothetical protein